MLNVFISWSGDRSKFMAAALDDLLPDILQDVRTWMSDHHIGAGSRWAQELSQQLELTNFGVLCLTPENLTAPWLLFEAGALAKKVEESRVIPLRLDLKATDVEFPLAQFQSVDANEVGVRKLIETINSALPIPLEAQRLSRLFHNWYPGLKQRLEGIPKLEPSETRDRRTDRDLIEETLRLVRNLRLAIEHPTGDINQIGRDRLVKPDDVGDMTDGELHSLLLTAKLTEALNPVGSSEALTMSLNRRMVERELSRRVQRARELADEKPDSL